MRHTLAFLLLMLSQNVFCQTAQQEINEQVWKPFIQTFNSYDTDGFLAVHSKDVVRSPREAKSILNWDEYYQQQKKGDERGKQNASKRTLELRFTERIASKDRAIEVGVYKTTSFRADGTSRSFYGRFHVVLLRENTTWKILVDTDSSEGGTIGEADFLKAQALE